MVSFVSNSGSPSRDPIFARSGSTALTRSSSQRNARASLRGENFDQESGGMEDERGRTRTRSVTRMTNQASLVRTTTRSVTRMTNQALLVRMRTRSVIRITNQASLVSTRTRSVTRMTNQALIVRTTA